MKKNQPCRFCKWYPQCHGGCPDHYDGFRKQNAYCLDYQRVFQHIQNALKACEILDDNGNVNIDKIDLIPNKIVVDDLKSKYKAHSLPVEGGKSNWSI